MTLRSLNMSFWSKFISFITPPAKKVEKVIEPKIIKKTPVVKAKRARTKKGKFVADDKTTANINEAWVGGKAPAKKSKKKK